jgi:hypothetical protein
MKQVLLHLLLLTGTLVPCTLSTVFLCHIGRNLYCQSFEASKATLSQLWCHYLSRDLRGDVAIFFVLGLVVGTILFSFYIRKLKLRNQLSVIAKIWLIAAIIEGARYLLRALGIEYSS